jgi:hypothetical protein
MDGPSLLADGRDILQRQTNELGAKVDRHHDLRGIQVTGFSPRNLKSCAPSPRPGRMRQLQQVAAQIPWTRCLLLDATLTEDRLFYIEKLWNMVVSLLLRIQVSNLHRRWQALTN